MEFQTEQDRVSRGRVIRWKLKRNIGNMTLELYNIESIDKGEVESYEISDNEKQILDKIVRWKLVRNFDPKYGKRQGQIYGSIYGDKGIYGLTQEHYKKKKIRKDTKNRLKELKDKGIVYLTWYCVPVEEADMKIRLSQKNRIFFENKNKKQIRKILKQKLNYLANFEITKYELQDFDKQYHKRDWIDEEFDMWKIKEKNYKKRKYLIVDDGNQIRIFFDSRYPYWHTSPYRLQFADGYYMEDFTEISREEWLKIKSRIKEGEALPEIGDKIEIGFLTEEGLIDYREWQDFVHLAQELETIPDTYENDFKRAFPNLAKATFDHEKGKVRINSLKPDLWFEFWTMCNIAEALLLISNKAHLYDIFMSEEYGDEVKENSFSFKFLEENSFEQILPSFYLEEQSKNIYAWSQYISDNILPFNIAIETSQNRDESYEIKEADDLGYGKKKEVYNVYNVKIGRKNLFEWKVNFEDDTCEITRPHPPEVLVIFYNEKLGDKVQDLQRFANIDAKKHLLVSQNEDLDEADIPNKFRVLKSTSKNYNLKETQRFLKNELSFLIG